MPFELGDINTNAEDKMHFASERARFLIEAANFKLGQIAQGIAATNTLESMYQVLLSSRHKDRGMFRGKIHVLRQKIINMLSRKGDREFAEEIKDKEFLSMVEELNGLVYEFYEIKSRLEGNDGGNASS